MLNNHSNPYIHSTTIDSITRRTGLETVIFDTSMCVAPDVTSQHFRANLLHHSTVATYADEKLFSNRELEVIDKM